MCVQRKLVSVFLCSSEAEGERKTNKTHADFLETRLDFRREWKISTEGEQATSSFQSNSNSGKRVRKTKTKHNFTSVPSLCKLRSGFPVKEKREKFTETKIDLLRNPDDVMRETITKNTCISIFLSCELLAMLSKYKIA